MAPYDVIERTQPDKVISEAPPSKKKFGLEGERS